MPLKETQVWLISFIPYRAHIHDCYFRVFVIRICRLFRMYGRFGVIALVRESQNATRRKVTTKLLANSFYHIHYNFPILLLYTFQSNLRTTRSVAFYYNMNVKPDASPGAVLVFDQLVGRKPLKLVKSGQECSTAHTYR